MFADLGWTGWLFLALGWIVAGLGVAWFFGRMVDAGKAERSRRPIPFAVRSCTDRAENRSDAPAPIATTFNHPANLG